MCSITYTSMIFDETAQTITLKGTSDCGQVTAAIVSPHFTNSKTTGVNANSEWTIVFSGNDILVTTQEITSACNERVKVNSFCAEDDSCGGPEEFLLQCQSSSACPDVQIVIEDISKCDGNSRTVTLTINYQSAPNPTILQLSYGDGDNAIADSVIDGSGSITHVHNYAAGQDYTPSVMVIFPQGCTTASTELHVEKCDDECPGINDLQFIVTDSAGSQINYNNCLPAGDYKIIVTAPSGNGLNFTWNGGQASNTNLPNERRVNLVSGDIQTISFTIIKDGCTDPIPGAVTLEECSHERIECPSISFQPVIPAPECDTQGRRNTSINATVSIGSNSPVSATMSVRNSNSEIYSSTVSSNNGVVSLSANLNLSPGTYIVRVTVNEPSGCPFSEETIIVAECERPVDCEFTENIGPCINGQRTITRTIITPPANGGRPCPPLTETQVCLPPVCDVCCIWNWINIIALPIIAAIVFIAFCSLTVTAVNAIIAFLTGGAWAPVAASLTTFNVVMLILAAVLVALWLISYILWLFICALFRPDPCGMLRDLNIMLASITTIAAILIAIFAFIPAAIGCLVGAIFILGWVGTILGITTLIYFLMGCDLL